MHKIFIFIPLLILTFLAAQGQRLVEGNVRDARTGEPLQKATVIEKGTENGDLTDSEGWFSLKTKSTVPVIKVSYVGYFTQEHKVTGDAALQITIELQPKSVDLEEVQITGVLIQQVYHDSLTHIHNYEFAGENLVLLIQEPGESQHKLILYNLEDSILDISIGPEPIASLFRDCFGKVHALGKHFAYQLIDPKDRIELGRDSLAAFERVVKPVLGYLDSTLFYRRYLGDHQAQFLKVKAGSRELVVFYATEDQEKLRRTQDDAIMASKGVALYGWFGGPGAGAREGTQAKSYAHYMKKIGNAPIIEPLIVINEEVVIFDHANDKLLRFDGAGQLTAEAPISYHEKRFWRKTVLTDEIRGEAYTVFRKNGESIIREIDLVSGELTGQWVVPKQFINKLRVRNGYAWFIYKDNLYDDKKRLYRMQLK